MTEIASFLLREELGLARAGELTVASLVLREPLPGPGPHRLVAHGPDGRRRALQVLGTSPGTVEVAPTVAVAAVVDLAADASETWTVHLKDPSDTGTDPARGHGAADQSKEITVDSPKPQDPPMVFVRHEGACVTIETGELNLTLTTGDEWLRAPALLPGGMRVTAVLSDVTAFAAVDRVTVVHSGPLLAEVQVVGEYRIQGRRSGGFEARVRVGAGTGRMRLDVTFVADTATPEVELGAWSVELGVGTVDTVTVGAFHQAASTSPPVALLAHGEGHARGIFATSTVQGQHQWTDCSLPGYHDQWEWAELAGRKAQNWVAARAAGMERWVAVERFTEHHPARIHCDAKSIVVDLVDARDQPVLLTQGAAPRRRLEVGAGDRFIGASLDTPVVPWQPSALSQLAPSILPYLPQAYPNLESRIRGEIFGWAQQGQALGFYDHGDGTQGTAAGPRTGYSSNNEHDAVLALTLLYLRSGERAALDSAVAYADHTVDIDQIHATNHDHELGGVRAHGHRHVHYTDSESADGRLRTSIDTGHLWVEGLVMLDQVTGEPRYLEAAEGVGQCILRLERLGWTRPEPGPRNAGWPLVALTSLAARTADATYLDASHRIADSAVAAQDEDGRWTMRLGYRRDYCAWQNAVLLVGLCKLAALDPNPRLFTAIKAGGRAMLEHGRTAEGTFAYLSRYDYRWVHRTGLVREALAKLHELTDDSAYLQAGLLGGPRWYAPAGRARTTSEEVAEWRGHLPFLGRAHQAGLLEDET